MIIETPAIAETKNNWLYAQVDVEFPTKESLAGRALYQSQVEHKQYQELNIEALSSSNDLFAAEDVFIVDFHRLTVMFSILFAKQWQSDEEQQLIIEFLTQIIYSEPCELYVGFQNEELVATAILTRDKGQLLVSDIATLNKVSDSKMSFVKAVLAKQTGLQDNSDIYLEI